MRDCEHGQLARSCDRCEDAATIARLREELAAAHDEKIRLSALAGDNLMRADSLAADLAALRARVYAASSALRSELTLHCGSENVLTDGMKYALAILAPPEGP